ncbi:phage minor capsid protein [Neobittarella massiliensis]|uniref:Phage minor capsid protein n=1 Tax=Neobittarella massiliensis (ex Bilen et al. 2018) TaxID=2041842 RepID=A0A8J6IQK9_9FIRM|nr:phage minor capsid protein [Neobittarella massiliensis]MBC3517210.1 phage minor capsid protein [Neobittarella massiliensis]
MLDPQYLDHLPDRVVELYTGMEERILEDMARRISKVQSVTDTVKWQSWRAEQLGAERAFIRSHLQRLTGKSQGEINQLFLEAGEQALYYDDMIYRAAGLSPLAISNSPVLQRILSSGVAKTRGLFENLTSTTANTATRQFERALDAAYMDMISGAFSYQDAIRSAVKSLTSKGLDAITYPSGRTDKLDVAVRRAVLTGINQTAGQLSDARATEMGCDLVETTAHAGARPEHAAWQGKIFSRSGHHPKYPDFVSTTGYGTGAGLCGWNCRHSFYPYFEGLSRNSYTRRELNKLNSTAVEYKGQTLSVYDASQVQRKIERKIRRWKREYKAMEAAGLDVGEASVRLSKWRATQADFSSQTGMRGDNFRQQVLGFGRSQAAKATAIQRDMQRFRAALDGLKAPDGTVLQGTEHVYLRARIRSVSAEDIADALTRWLEKGKIKVDDLGRPSYKLIGERATIAINPDTGNITSVWKTGRKTVAKLKRGKMT